MAAGPLPIGGYVTFPDERDPGQGGGYAGQPPYGRMVDLEPRLGSITLGDGRTVGFLGLEANKRTYVPLGFAQTMSMAASKTWGTITDTIYGITQAVRVAVGPRTSLAPSVSLSSPDKPLSPVIPASLA